MESKRLGLVLFFATTLSFGVVAQKQLQLDADEVFQPIDGFGASDAWRTQFVGENWPEHKRERIAELLFSKEVDAKGNPKGIGLSVWRYYIGSGGAELGDSSDIQNEWRRSECFQNPDGTYDWSKNKGQDWFLRAARRYGVEKFLGFSIAAPAHMAINGRSYSIAGDARMNVKPGKLDDYAAYLVDVLEYYQREGIAFDYLSPFNEPQWDWATARQEGTAATNEDIFLFVKYLSKALEASDLETKLLLGEAGKIDFLYEEHGDEARGDQIDVFFNPDSPLYLADLPHVSPFITGHSYFTTWPLETQYATRQKLKQKLDEYPELNYLQSEFCILEKSPEVGAGQKRDLGMNTALYVARVIHSDITIAQSQGWEWWTALTTFDYKDGLIYLDTGDPEDLFNRNRMKQDGELRESKLLWAMGNYARFIRPGMLRIAADLEGTGDSLQVSAYKNAKQAVIVINNHETQSIAIAAPAGFETEAMYVTDDKRNLERVRFGKKKLKIPARSVVTLVGTIDQ